jgi:hypothetical protein
MKVQNLRQGGHGRIILGFGDKTIGQSGCLLTCFAMAYNALTFGRVGVVELNEILKTAKSFRGSGLDCPTAAKTLGLAYRAPVEFTVQEVLDHIEQDDDPVILGVDYKKGRSSGLSDADHFVLAYTTGKTGDGRTTIIAADPATGFDVHFEIEVNENAVGGSVLVCNPSPRVRWKVAEARFLARK